MSESIIAFSQSSDDDDSLYKAVSRSAVAAMVLAVLGLISIWFVPMLVLPFAGSIVALYSLAQFRKYPDELTGKPVAKFAFVACSALFIGATALHIYTYYTEVPEGYTRIAFSQLKSPIYDLDYPPDSALELDGKAIFLKGFILPTSLSSSSSNRFVLVPDIATCCFGGQPKLTHMVEVQLPPDMIARFRLKQVRLAGTLSVDRQLHPNDAYQGTYYQLKADVFRQ